MTIEKILKYILIAAGIVVVLCLLPFLFHLLAPFAAAFVIAALSQRLVRYLEKRIKISRGISSAALVTLITATAAGIIFIIIFQIFSQVKNLISALPYAVESFQLRLSELYTRYNGYKISLPPEISSILDTLTDQLQDKAQHLAEPLTQGAINTAKKFATALPGIILFFSMFILATFFFTKDYILIINFIHEIFPERFLREINKLKKSLVHGFSSYLKAQLILMSVTAALVTVSLWVVGMSYPLVWGIVCGLVDGLPFFGTAIILVPWAIISLLYGDIYSFTALIIIQALTFVVRQLAEPKIVSQQIGIHPILTLISVYIGLKYFGIFGVIIAPILTLLAVNLYLSFRQQS